jgi:tetratricopeptide (TPR) repeat protein
VLSDLLSAQPGDPEVCRLLAMLHVKRGELAVALSEIQFLSEAAIRAEDYGLAESMILEYLKADQQCVSLLELLGTLYEHKGEPSPAAIQYGKAIYALLERPDPEAPDRPSELFAKIKILDPASPMIAEISVALASPRSATKIDRPSEMAAQPTREIPETTEDPVTALAPESKPVVLKLAEAAQGSSPAPFPVPSSEATPDSEKEASASVPQDEEVAEPHTLRFAESTVSPAPAEKEISSEVPEVQRREPVEPPSQDSSAPVPTPSHPMSRQITEHEYSVHYELGMAYKNMGMLDEAVEEFRMAINGKDCFLDAATLLAASLKEKGLPEPAMECLEHVLADARCDQGKAVPIRYELGLLYEADGLFEKAIKMFSSISAFLDVPMRLERLKAGQTPHPSEGENLPGEPTSVAAANAPSTERKKRRISYL